MTLEFHVTAFCYRDLSSLFRGEVKKPNTTLLKLILVLKSFDRSYGN